MSGRKGLAAVWRDALRDSNLGRTPKLVGFVLSTFMDSRGLAWPSKATIAAGGSLGRGRRSVDLAIDELERAGFLVVARERKPFRYVATLPEKSHALRHAEWAKSQETTQDVARAARDVARRATESGESAESTGAAAPNGAAPVEECFGCGNVQELVGLLVSPGRTFPQFCGNVCL